MFLLAEVPLAEYLLSGVLPVAEGEMVVDVFELLEKEMIPPESVTLEEGEVLLFSGASLVIWYSWDLFSSVDWIGGHQRLYF